MLPQTLLNSLTRMTTSDERHGQLQMQRAIARLCKIPISFLRQFEACLAFHYQLLPLDGPYIRQSYFLFLFFEVPPRASSMSEHEADAVWFWVQEAYFGLDDMIDDLRSRSNGDDALMIRIRKTQSASEIKVDGVDRCNKCSSIKGQYMCYYKGYIAVSLPMFAVLQHR